MTVAVFVGGCYSFYRRIRRSVVRHAPRSEASSFVIATSIRINVVDLVFAASKRLRRDKRGYDAYLSRHIHLGGSTHCVDCETQRIVIYFQSE
jgi:hypothetical protein